VTALLAAVALASLIGSPHCVGMCGPLMLLATDVVQIGPAARPPRWSYHWSRALAYAALGAVAGFMGGTLETSAAARGWSGAAGMIAAVIVAAFGLSAMMQAAGIGVVRFLPSSVIRFQRSAGAAIARFPPRGRAIGMGLLSALLPCGWLYAFVAVAGGTASATAGAAVMLAFWMGTLPALLTVGIGARTWMRSWPKARFASAALTTFIGLAVVGERLHFASAAPPVVAQERKSAETLLETAVDEVPPCCR
jgi:sulfite exporter TauE/SafE